MDGSSQENGRLTLLFYRFIGSKALTSTSITAFIIFYMWIVVSRYHSVFLAGLIITIYLAVELALAIPIGHLIDRFNNTRLNLLSSVLVLGGFGLLLFNDNLPFIYSATVISVLGQALKIDSFSAIIKKHLPEESFKKANSVNFATGSVSSLVGTVIGGFSIIYISRYFVYVIVMIAVASIFLAKPVQEKSYRPEENKMSMVGEMKSVGIFLKRIAGFLVLAFFLNGLFISLDTYSSGLFNIVLKSTAFYYTLFSLAVPLGMISGTPIANIKYFRGDRPVFISFLMLVFSPLIIVLSIGRSPILDILIAFAIGVILPLINIPISTKLMKAIPHSIYGKVTAVVKIFTQGASPVMGAVFASLVIFFNIPTVLLWVGILVVPLTFYGLIIIPKFFRFSFGIS